MTTIDFEQINKTAYKIKFSKIFWRFTKIFSPLFIILFIILAGINYSQVNSLIVKIYDEEYLALDLQKRYIQLEFSSLLSYINLLANGDHYNSLYDKNDNIRINSRAAISNEFLRFSKANYIYSNIRFIDNTGMEVVRINFNNGKPGSVETSALQNKKNRYYFKEISKLQKNEIFVSPLDLNIENQIIEIPYNPVIRLGTPIFDQNNKRIGLVIVNYMANRFLTTLNDYSLINPGEIMLLNENSFWLKCKNPDDEWGFMFKEKNSRSFANKFPSEWQEVSKKDNGQFETEHGLFTFQTVYPFINLGESKQENLGVISNEKFWKVLSHIPASYIFSEKVILLYSFIPVFIFLTLVIAIGSWIVAIVALQKALKDQELKIANENLEKKVISRTQQLSEINIDLEKEIKKHRGTAKKLRIKTDELECSNKDLEEFAYIASHDLQEPLRKINSFTKLLEKHYQGNGDEESDRYISFISSATERMKIFISELLKYSRVGSAKITFDLINLNEIMKIVFDDLEMSIKESNAEINYNTLPEIKADKSQMTQLLSNLLSNAIKFHDDKKNEHPKVFINAVKEETNWIISIKDNGIGIDRKNHDKIFIIFQRLHGRSEHSGTGIGLGICKKIVERHAGKIWLKSEKGKGSTFYFSIKV